MPVELEVMYEGKTALFCASSLLSMSSYVEVLGTLTHVKNNCYCYEKCIFSFNKPKERQIFDPVYRDRNDF